MNTDTLLHWLLRTSIEASMLILAVLGLRLMFGTRLSPAWRIGLWMLVGMKLMLPAFIPAGFGLGGWFQSDETVQASSSKNVIALVHGSSSIIPLDSENPQMIAPEPIGGFSESVGILSANRILLTLWLVGAFAVFAGAIIRQRRFESFLRRRPRTNDPHLTSHLSRLTRLLGIPSPEIFLMPSGTTPAMVGVREPKLLLPEDWQTRFDDRSLRHVLLHELLHVKQHDLLWNWVAIALQALHWFNPLVWFVVSRFQSDRELRCDAEALALLSPAERLDYGHTLLRIQETFFAPPTIAGLAPCVRNHPTLRQRISMIAHPTTRQPWLHALLVLTLSVLVGYSFTTARAVEKEVKPKVREGETIKKPAATPQSTDDSNEVIIRKLLPPGTELTRTTFQQDIIQIKGWAPKLGHFIALKDSLIESPELKNWVWEIPHPASDPDGRLIFFLTAHPANQRDDSARKVGTDDRESGTPSAEREGGKPNAERDGGTKKPGTRDSEGEKKPGMRDGDKPRTGGRDGEKPRTGERDDDGMKKGGERDGVGRKPSAESGQKPRKGDGDRKTNSSGGTLTLKVIDGGDTVLIGDEKVPMNRLRGFLSTYLPEHLGARVEVTGNDDTPLKALHNTVDAVRDNGNKNVGIKAE